MAELRVSPGGKRDTPPQPLTELDLILAAVRELHALNRPWRVALESAPNTR